MNQQHTRRADFGADVSNKVESAGSAGSAGMSQRQVAAELGMRKSTVADLELKALAKIRAAFVAAGYSAEDFGRL